MCTHFGPSDHLLKNCKFIGVRTTMLFLRTERPPFFLSPRRNITPSDFLEHFLLGVSAALCIALGAGEHKKTRRSFRCQCPQATDRRRYCGASDLDVTLKLSEGLHVLKLNS